MAKQTKIIYHFFFLLFIYSLIAGCGRDNVLMELATQSKPDTQEGAKTTETPDGEDEGAIPPEGSGGDVDAIDKVGELSVSDEELIFEDVGVGEKESKDLTITNEGDGELNIDEMIIDDDSENFIKQGECLVLEPGGSCTVKVDFIPDRPGQFNAKVAISSDNPVKPEIIVNLTGSGKIISTSIATPDKTGSISSAFTRCYSFSKPKNIYAPKKNRAILRFAWEKLDTKDVSYELKLAVKKGKKWVSFTNTALPEKIITSKTFFEIPEKYFSPEMSYRYSVGSFINGCAPKWYKKGDKDSYIEFTVQ